MKLLTLLMALIAIACGPQAQAPSGPQTRESTPKAGGVLNVRMTSDPYVWELRHNG